MKAHSPLPCLLFLLALCLAPNRATSSVSLGLDLWHGYDFFYAATTLSASDPAPVTFHRLESPSGAIWRNIGSSSGASSSGVTNLNALLNEFTNGVWKLYLNKDHPSEEVYYFPVSITDVTTNEFGDAIILFPADGSSGITNLPTFHFTGPDHFPLVDLYVADDPNGTTWYDTTLSGSSTNWTPPGPLAPGDNSLLVAYRFNNHPGFMIDIPTNSAGTPLSDWSSQGSLHTYAYSFFNVQSSGNGGGHALQVHYSFEDADVFATDFSGNGNDAISLSSTGGGTRFITNNPAVGNHSAFFSNNGGAGGGWLNAPTNLLATLADSFTVSLWVQTTQVYGNDSDSGLFGNAGLVSAFTGPGSEWVVPMAITGSKLAFATGGFPQDTLHSAASITNDALIHVAVTRDRNTGEKRVYINGALDAVGNGSTDLLDSSTSLRIGFNNGTGLNGVLDDIQIYSGVLSAAEIAFLYDNPGETVPDVGGSPLGHAVDAPELVWTTGGDADWFAQTDETNDDVDAAQSGAIDHDQSSWIETTVQGPGTFSFWWNVSSEDFDGYDVLEFTINDNFETSISGEWGWDSYEIHLEPGEHTLRWTYWKDSDFTGGVDAAWLDEVVFLPEIEVNLNLSIERARDTSGEFYHCFPFLSYVSIAELTVHEVESPSGLFSGDTSSSSTATMSSLQDLIEELQAGPWTLYLNRGHATERQYTFHVTVTGLDTNDLPPTMILSPTLWSTVPPSSSFAWSGPTNFSSLFVNSFLHAGGASGGSTSLPPATQQWDPAGPLAEGTNGFLVIYTLSDFQGVELSDPMDASSNPLSSWFYSVDLRSRDRTHFIVGESAPASAVEILGPGLSGGAFSFGFATQDGRMHTIQAATNLTTAPWVDLTNFMGDGGLFEFQMSTGGKPETYFRVGSQ